MLGKCQFQFKLLAKQDGVHEIEHDFSKYYKGLISKHLACGCICASIIGILISNSFNNLAYETECELYCYIYFYRDEVILRQYTPVSK